MKKLIITLMSFLSFAACTSNKNIEDPIYIKDIRTYSIIDNKAVSGTVTTNTGGSIKKKLYKDGVLRRVETRDIDGNIKTEVNYDHMGLKHGIKKEEQTCIMLYYFGL